MRLSGKRCVVTGAGSGIGRATAILYAKEGGKVVVADMNEGGIKETVRLIKENGGDAIAQICDVSNEKHVESLVEKCCSEFGGIDVCYANAGVSFLL